MVSRQQQQKQFNTAPLRVAPIGPKQRHNSRAFIFVLIGFCLFFSLRYTSRLIEYGQEQVTLEQWEQKIAEAKLDQAELHVYRDYVLTDAYVESVSRRELLMARPGDTLVVVLPEQNQLANESENGVVVNGGGESAQPAEGANPAPILVDAGQDATVQVEPSQSVSAPVQQLQTQTETNVQSKPVWQQWFHLFSQTANE